MQRFVMLFNSGAFAIFLPVVFIVYWSLRGEARRWWLLGASYFFYGWWDWRFTGLLAVHTLVDYGCAIGIDRRRGTPGAKRFLLLSVLTNLSVLSIFKYLNFFRDSLVGLFAAIGWHVDAPTLHVILPLGISFYTFQTMSYTIDVYRGMSPERNVRDFALSISCFAHLVAGPIVRARDLMPQFKLERRFSEVDLSGAVYRLFRGLFKKMVVADLLALYVDAVFADPGGYRGASAWIALYAYAFQIYMDFSGYTDVALACANLFGLRFAENFDRPYLAASPAEFWRRWHISLSTWLRDYLYIPLGGSRGGRWFTVRNLLITMALGGLWHGAAWTFVAWGAYHGILLAGQRLLKESVGPTFQSVRMPATVESDRQECRSHMNEDTVDRLMRVLRIVAMFHLTCLGWLLFRASDWGNVRAMLFSLFNFAPGELHGRRVLVVIALCVFAHIPWKRAQLGEWFRRAPSWGQGALAAMCMWSLLLLSPTARPFIYFQF